MARRSPQPSRKRHDRRRSFWIVAAVIAIAATAGWLFWRRAAPRRPNIVLITIDTLRADHVGAYGAGPGLTPTLDGLAAGGVRFDRAETAVPLTGPAHATILTGQYPPTHGVRGNVVFTLGSRYPTLATRLKRAGYVTAAFVGAYPVAAAFGFGQDFDTFNEEFHESAPGEQGAERRANDVADAAIRWLSSGQASGRAFFMWTHFYDPHAPYDPPEPFRTRFAGRPYDGEIAFADAQIGRVLDALRSAGHADDTVVIALADHGEGLGDHHEMTHGVLVYQSTLRVPFIVSAPGIGRGRVVDAPVA